MEIITTIGSKIGEYLVEGIVNQARYIFCFNNIVKDLEDEENKLTRAQERIKKEVKREEKNTKVIEKEVAEWLKDVDDVTKDVEELKVKIQADKDCFKGWCPNWACRYWLGRKAAKKTITMTKLQNGSNFNTVARLKSLPGIEFSALNDFMSFEATELASNQIIEALKDESIKMVGLCGSGGVGKTTLAKNIGIKLQQQKFFDDVVVVAISQNPDFKKIQNKLAEQLGLKFEEKDEEHRAKRLHMRFIDPKSKILLILDDVWKKHDLKIELGIPVDDNHNGCKILLTTRLRQVCDRMGCNYRIPLDILKPEEGLALLRKYAGFHDDDSTLIEVSKEVAGECKGLPLAIAAVGSALKGKDADEWKLVYQNLKKAKLVEVDGIDVDVYACLKLSYDYLKDEKEKFCFMLCSLFPEDHEIDLEDLVRYGVGLDWYQNVTIEEARSLLRGKIKGLKASFLLLDIGNEGFVKMHDVVRDVAIWIGSKEKTFLSKAGNGLTEWPKDEALEQYTTISLVENEIEVLPNGLVCPNLNILLLGGHKINYRLEVPDQFFEGMKSLKIVTIIGGNLSVKSLQYLTDLQVVQLIDCLVRDVAFFGELKHLQILCMKLSSCDDIPSELGYKLSKLKLLQVGGSISPSSIKRFSQLEEFYGTVKNWEVEGMSLERCYKNIECLPKNFIFPKLQRYGIVNIDAKHIMTENTLMIGNVEATSLVIFSGLYQNLKYLRLEKVSGCQNIVPSIDQKSLTELTSLQLGGCEDLECVMDVSQHVKSQNLVLLSGLALLVLRYLPKLRWIWKAPTQRVNLENLTGLEVEQCNNLTYLFTSSQARSLAQLKSLCVRHSNRLNCVIEAKFDGNEGEKDVLGGDEITIVLPMLRKLELSDLPNLISFCSENYHSTWKVLQEIELRDCPLLDISKELRTSVQYLVEELQYLVVDNCYHLRDAIPELLKHGLKKLKKLWILRVGVQVVFQQLEEDISGDGQESKLLFPHLKELDLWYLPELEVLYKDPAHIFTLQNLMVLNIWGHNKLRNVISPTLAQNLLQLDILGIEGCSELEQIIVEEDDDDHRQRVCFPKLRKLVVWNCPKLKRLFHISVAPTLQMLKEISITDNDELEEVFWHKDGADVMDDKEIVMTRLQLLELRNLPKLINFFPMGYQFASPSLSTERVKSCPKYHADKVKRKNCFVNHIFCIMEAVRETPTNITNISLKREMPVNNSLWNAPWTSINGCKLARWFI